MIERPISQARAVPTKETFKGKYQPKQDYNKMTLAI
jgi:hypothetical protein